MFPLEPRINIRFKSLDLQRLFVNIKVYKVLKRFNLDAFSRYDCVVATVCWNYGLSFFFEELIAPSCVASLTSWPDGWFVLGAVN